MGSPEGEAARYSNESPQHNVTVPSFFMGQYEVTQAQYEAVMGTNPTTGKAFVCNATTCTPDTQIPAKFLGDNKPVVGVSWDDAQAFIKKLNEITGKNYRLPTEAEWEYAARAGTTTPFSYGETITPEVVNYNGNAPYGNAPKGQYREGTIAVNELNPNPWGLHHIHGNVWEWVQDQYYDSYNNKPSNLLGDGSIPWIVNTNVPANSDYHVLRGGSWFFNARNTRSADRDGDYRVLRNNDNGFRVVLVP
jgi:formylglycine-generating enzyme required for sulfatase activity